MHAIGGMFHWLASYCEAGFRTQAASIPVDHETVPVLTFRDAVSRMTSQRPNESRVVKAALLRESSGDKLKIITVYLDAGNGLVMGPTGIPFGRAQITKEMDCELQEFFGARSMVLFE